MFGSLNGTVYVYENMIFIIFLLSIGYGATADQYYYTKKYIDMPLDHFSYTSNLTFKLKYLINDTYHEEGGPIFFYTGNEGPIETFAQNSGFINDITPNFNALIVFAEHRYYGESLPFGNKSYTSPQYLGYLSSEQALADFVYLINDLQKEHASGGGKKKLPVIAFGGSYGGMLSAWLRMKYPASVVGAIATSAPIWQFQDLVPCDNFYRITTNVYSVIGGSTCVDNIAKSWKDIRRLAKNDTGKANITKAWTLCNPLKTDTDINELIDYLSEIYINLAMVNYPYPTSFLAPLPAHPIREFCSRLNKPYKTDAEMLASIGSAIGVFTNFTGTIKCNDIKNPDGTLGATGWDFQYGGKDIKSASNIVFSNGLMDPWSGGGVLSNVSSTVVVIIIPDGAHHIDLRGHNDLDPDTVKSAREFHVRHIQKWLHSYYLQKSMDPPTVMKVIIQGFKSYRDQTVVEPFDKRHNVVVGRNGSGKSNFFYAIQFVLSDEYSHLRPEQRQALLHEGTGPRALSAYVEIIFDNSDSRVPLEQEEIFLKRVIGAKKDQYFLNKKVVPRTEVMNLLESAGFSNSNPYYIVKQGKKIEEYLRTIEERLSTLEEEKEELKQYQHYDKIRRALEYIIHEVELNENKKKLADLEKQRNESGTEQEKLKANLKKAQDNIKTLTKKVKETKKELNSLKEERDMLTNDQQHLIKEKAKLDLTIKDLSEEVLGDNKSKERAENELARLTHSIKEKEAELEKIKPQYEAMKKREDECTRELALKEQKRKELYAKQGRGSQFTSKDDRDRWIQNELKSLNKQLKDKKEHRDKLEADLKRDANKVIELTKKIEEQTQELERQKNFIDEHNKQIYELKKNKDQFQATRNELWRKENNVQQNLSSLKEDLAKADQQLRSMVGKPILNGRDSVRKVLDTFTGRGGREAEVAKHYHGPVIENFDCEKSIYTAVEVTAGNRLFHHVVDTDIVGTQILKEMNRQSLPGEVNFMPLNRLNVRELDYPNDADAIPMVSKLHYDQKYDKAMRFLFGKTLICRNLDVATKLARTTGLDCVTLDGDQVSSKGSLTGGYFNSSRSRLEMQKNRSETIAQIQQCEQELKQLRTELAKTETSINSIVSEMQKTETKNSKAKAIYDKVKGELRLMREELSNIERFRGPKERSLAQCKSSLEAMQTTKEGLESELHQDLLSQLSVQDQQQVDMLNDDIQRLQKENKEAFSTRMKLEAEKNKLENLLTNNLIRRRDEVLHALQEISLEDRKRQLTNCKSELEEIDKKIDKVNKDLAAMENKVKEMAKRLKVEQVDLENWKKKERDAQDKIDEDAKHLEKFATKQNLLEQKIAESLEKINQLGALPAQDLYTQYSKMTSRYLFKELEKANNHLKKFSHVNKKALDQFMSFSEQKEKLQKRKEELDRGDEKIKELIATLEQKKMEAIQFTFKQFSKYFTEVFKKLVPDGRAKLVLKTVDHSEGHEIGPDDKNADNFTGIGIKISFTGSDAEMKEMNQLSGGQKSLVALALIFAIQKCDPAPFYLFDEIDQALDPQYRRAVANMIHELSGEAQFITTTFRPELLEHANKFYGVKFRNKVSHVECVSRDVARDFVEDDQTHG
nr:unnamed protein product [Callosobruchus chinensis]